MHLGFGRLRVRGTKSSLWGPLQVQDCDLVYKVSVSFTRLLKI